MQAAAVNQLITDQLTKFIFDGDNRLQFLSGFPEVAAHFGVTALIYGEPPMARPDIREEGVELAEVQEWDRLNAMALGKFKHYLHEDVYRIVWKGNKLTALEFYDRLFGLFLRGDSKSRNVLEEALQACTKRSNETVLQWWARLDSIYAEFELIGHPKSDETKKTKAMFLIGDELATMAELLGGSDDVTYLEFQTAMLKRDRERRMYGVTRDQALADATASRPQVPMNFSSRDPTAQQDGAFAITARHEWRGSNFTPPQRRGFGQGRGNDNRGRRTNDSHKTRRRLEQRNYNPMQYTQHEDFYNGGSVRDSHSSNYANNFFQCLTCGGWGHTSAQCPTNARAQANILSEHQNLSEENEEDFNFTFCFMLYAASTIIFPFNDRKALVSIDSNCSQHMTSVYPILNSQPCNIHVAGAFAQHITVKGTFSGTMRLGNLFFEDALYVEGLRETVLSLGQLDSMGCKTIISSGKMEVHGHSGLMFTAFLFQGRYFLDEKFYHSYSYSSQMDAHVGPRFRQPKQEIPQPTLSSVSNFISFFFSSEDGKHRTTRLMQAANYLSTYSIGSRFIIALIRFFLGFSMINKLFTVHLKFCGEAVNAKAELLDLTLLSQTFSNQRPSHDSAGQRIFEQTFS